MRFLLLLLLIFTFGTSYSQNDTIFFKNGDLIVGEIKSLDRGVVIVETDYSDSDFKIEWDGIHRIHTQSIFFVMLSTAESLYGRLESTTDSLVRIETEEGYVQSQNMEEIVILVPINRKFGDRFSASIDIGFSITKANDLRQFTSRSTVGYKADKWTSEATFNTLRSIQNEADTIQRTEGGIIFRYLIGNNWFVSLSESFLSNTEQKLDWRSNSKLGFGRYLIHTNRSHWGIRIGINRNIERFSNETGDRYSWEGNFGTELDLFDIGDLSLLTSAMVYPSITESGRWRFDGVFDIKYDLPLDFYIKAGMSVNYDNQPAEGASDTDYVFQTGFGWEW